jgi:murein DD-endopeptidase MepM/ murein hydrolase activator NlpD
LKVASFILSIFCVLTFANDLPKSQMVPGGIVELYIQTKEMPEAFHKDKKLMVLKTDKDDVFRVVAGVGLDFNVSDAYPITLHVKNKSITKDIKIKDFEYKKQYIKLKSSKHVSLSKENLQRYHKESKLSKDALNSFSQKRFDSLKMTPPLHVKIKDDFGKRRYFNNNPRKPHSGVDLPAPKGTKIHAPLNGKVLIAQEFFFNGNTIYIDHGLGLISIYCHLDKLDVKKGDIVKQNQVIGRVGSTGRSTGDHLHFGVALNSKMVNPKLFF